MIKFFRHIRQNLLAEGKTSRYLKYAIGEIILVVIGILIALQVNDWNENRKFISEKQRIVNELHKAFINNKMVLTERIEALENANANVHSGPGIATGGPQESGYAGNYHVRYFLENGEFSDGYDLVIEKTGDFYDVSWIINGKVAAKGVGMEVENGLAVGWRRVNDQFKTHVVFLNFSTFLNLKLPSNVKGLHQIKKIEQQFKGSNLFIYLTIPIEDIPTAATQIKLSGNIKQQLLIENFK